MKEKFLFISLLNHQQKKFLIPLFFIIIFSTILEVLGIGLLVPFFNLLLNGKINYDNFFFQNLIKEFGYKNLIYFLIFLIFFIYTFKAFFLSFASFKQLKFLKQINVSVSKNLLNIYINKPFSFYLDTNTNYLTQMINEVNALSLHIRSQFILFTEAIIFASIVIVLLFNSFIFTLIMMILFGFFGLLLQIFVFNRAKNMGEKRLTSSHERLKDLREGFDGIREIKIFGLENYFISKFSANNDKCNEFEFKNAFTLSLPRFILEWLLIFLLIFLLFIIFLINDLADINKYIFTLSLFCIALLRVIPSVLRIVQSQQQIKYTSAIVKKILEEFKNERDKSNDLLISANNKKISDFIFHKDIIIDNIFFSYKNNRKNILKNLNIKINFGDFIGIEGPSGSGKTTLLSIILGLLKPDKGDIIVNQNSIFNNVRSWQNQISYVPQNLYLIDDTIQGNIALGLPTKEINLNLLSQVIKLSCLEDMINELPEGLITNVGELGMNLSGGQRQRIGIARALYRQPKLLILDEFTNALDKELEQKILNNIYSLKKNITAIIVSHDSNVLKNCDKIIKLN
jgi:ABC-type bacteriocin/lantibiotic exporter with double-glycine peptidase domain